MHLFATVVWSMSSLGKLQYILGQPTNVYFRQYKLTPPTRNQLYQANEIEKQILTTFFDLYDTFVYTSFLNMRNRQILLEEMIDIERNEITRLLVALWDVLCRVIENYDGYLDIMMRIEHEYLSPTGAEVNRLLNPHIGTRFEERMRMLMEEGIDAYPDMNLSVLRAEDSRFP